MEEIEKIEEKKETEKTIKIKKKLSELKEKTSDYFKDVFQGPVDVCQTSAIISLAMLAGGVVTTIAGGIMVVATGNPEPGTLTMYLGAAGTILGGVEGSVFAGTGGDIPGVVSGALASIGHMIVHPIVLNTKKTIKKIQEKQALKKRNREIEQQL